MVCWARRLKTQVATYIWGARTRWLKVLKHPVLLLCLQRSLPGGTRVPSAGLWWGGRCWGVWRRAASHLHILQTIFGGRSWYLVGGGTRCCCCREKESGNKHYQDGYHGNGLKNVQDNADKSLVQTRCTAQGHTLPTAINEKNWGRKEVCSRSKRWWSREG